MCLCIAFVGPTSRERSLGRLSSPFSMESASPSSTTANSTQEIYAQGVLMQQNEQIQAEQMFLLALQERLAQQLLPQNDLQRIWQNVMLGLPALLPPPLDLAAALPGTSQPLTHPLYQHNLCAWPQCDTPCENFAAFIHHLTAVHTLDERAAQQCRAQIELVDNLEHRLSKERTRLQAMMQHLHMKQSPDTTTPSLGNVPQDAPLTSPAIVEPKTEPLPEQPPLMPASSLPNTSLASAEEQRVQATPRRRISDKAVLPISADISRNREFYRTHDVRPPYTYASLIRQAIMESKDCQLTLNEIYQWFTETFAYFRRNAATWKNAVRHNLSLHKCFARVEQNVKGAVWTVDDSEFYRRRPQRAHASRSTPTTPKLENPLSLLSTAAASAAGLAADEALNRSKALNPEEKLDDLAVVTNAATNIDATVTSDVNTMNKATIIDGVSASSPLQSLNCSVSQKALDIFIKEEERSPKLVVDEDC
uniref:Fork-head domain-containing protein n=1 Tax=Parascaris univalens TaxID=6257 RepID=A0A915B5R2_PARUN